MRRVLVTGATGFVGQVLCEQLSRSGYVVRAALRTEQPLASWIAEKSVVGDIGATTEWGAALEAVDMIVHAAARTHVLREPRQSSELYMNTNAHGTLQLARAAAAAGVRRFIYVSSVKVNGEETDHTYRSGDEPNPGDAYGRSKLFGERAVTEAAGGTMETSIVRPPLVYGPGVRANFLRLMQWVHRGWPLPLGAVQNRRSLVNVWNLSDLLLKLLEHPQAPGRVWMISDGEDVSTPELIRRLGREMHRRAHLIPVPVGWLQLYGQLTGGAAQIRRLCGSLAVDASETGAALGWSAPVGLEEALCRTVQWFLGKRAR